MLRPNASLGAALSLLAQGNSHVKRLPQATTVLFYLFLSVRIADWSSLTSPNLVL